MASFPDPYVAGRARGWRIHDANAPTKPPKTDFDVVIVGAGAGGGITAEMLSKAGLNVAIVESGPLRSSSHFKMQEWDAFRELYQENGGRKVADSSIGILQGRGVGGGTTVNWMASFRPSPHVIDHWRTEFGLKDFSDAALADWFAQVESRLSIQPWPFPPNLNNSLLAKGGALRGIPFEAIKRNQRDCLDLGYCGMGCPANAKQSMLVTSIPAALDKGATLFENLAVVRVRHNGRRAESVLCRSANGQPLELKAAHVVLAAGAIGSPGVLLRSEAPDPHKRLGLSTFLHPTYASAGIYPEPVDAYRGAPQTLYSDHFIKPPQDRGPISFKLEVAPLHPALLASATLANAATHAKRMKELPHTQIAIALLRDGFHPEAAGGTVKLDADGDPVLHYTPSPYILEGARRAALALADIQFAAGARHVYPGHELTTEGFSTWAAAKAALETLPFEPHRARLLSAHVMGGCGMAAAPERGVTNGDGRHFQLDNVSIHDASAFPTALGSNPQETIFALAARASAKLAAALTKRVAPRLVDA